MAIGELSHQRTYMRRVEPGRWDLARLTLLDSVSAQVGRGAIGPHAASERLDAITEDDVSAEGFPDWCDGDNPTGTFVEFFCEHMRCKPDTEVTRIEWRYPGGGS